MRNAIILGFTWVFSAVVFSSCNFSPEAMAGKDQAADDAVDQALNQYDEGHNCDVIAMNTTAGTSNTCNPPDVSSVVITNLEGTDGDLVVYLPQLQDGTFPGLDLLTYQASEPKSQGNPVPNQYVITFSCTAMTDTPDHLRPFHCTAPPGSRLHAASQPGEGSAKFQELDIENTACHAKQTFNMSTSYCEAGEVNTLQVQAPTLGIAPPAR